jgi:hypothetical protein
MGTEEQDEKANSVGGSHSGLLILSAHGQPVPEDKAAYVGEWRAQTMSLLLRQNGTVTRKRIKDGATTRRNDNEPAPKGSLLVVGSSGVTASGVCPQPLACMRSPHSRRRSGSRSAARLRVGATSPRPKPARRTLRRPR